MKKNCLYERSLGKWVQYDEATYLALRRDRIGKRTRMCREKRCFQPIELLWQCDGMCEDCPHFRQAEVSWDTKVGGSEDLTLGEALPDGVDHEEVYVEKILAEDVMKRLDEIMPFARRIGLLRLEGKSDREIAKELGISRTSMYRMLDRAKAILQREFEEI